MYNTKLRIVGSSLLVAAFGFTGLAMTAAPASASTVQSVSTNSYRHDGGNRYDHGHGYNGHHERCGWNYGWYHGHHGHWDRGWYRDCDHGHGHY